MSDFKVVGSRNVGNECALLASNQHGAGASGDGIVDHVLDIDLQATMEEKDDVRQRLAKVSSRSVEQ